MGAPERSTNTKFAWRLLHRITRRTHRKHRWQRSPAGRWRRERPPRRGPPSPAAATCPTRTTTLLKSQVLSSATVCSSWWSTRLTRCTTVSERRATPSPVLEANACFVRFNRKSGRKGDPAACDSLAQGAAGCDEAAEGHGDVHGGEQRQHQLQGNDAGRRSAQRKHRHNARLSKSRRVQPLCGPLWLIFPLCRAPQSNDLDDASEPLNMSWPKEGRKRLTYVLVAPILVPLWITLPDTRTPRGKKFFVVTFLGSIAWIAAYSYLMVWWANVFGETADIPPEVSARERWRRTVDHHWPNVPITGYGIDILGRGHIDSGLNHVCYRGEEGIRWYGCFELCRKQYIWRYCRVSAVPLFRSPVHRAQTSFLQTQIRIKMNEVWRKSIAASPFTGYPFRGSSMEYFSMNRSQSTRAEWCALSPYFLWCYCSLFYLSLVSDGAWIRDLDSRCFSFTLRLLPFRSCSNTSI